MARGKWRKSSFSGDVNTDCVEVLLTTNRAGIRDSKNATGPALAVTVETWATFLTRVTHD